MGGKEEGKRSVEDGMTNLIFATSVRLTRATRNADTLPVESQADEGSECN